MAMIAPNHGLTGKHLAALNLLAACDEQKTRSIALYHMLISNGAFMFAPPSAHQSAPASSNDRVNPRPSAALGGGGLCRKHPIVSGPRK
jgi:hypothetical protein